MHVLCAVASHGKLTWSRFTPGDRPQPGSLSQHATEESTPSYGPGKQAVHRPRSVPPVVSSSGITRPASDAVHRDATTPDPDPQRDGCAPQEIGPNAIAVYGFVAWMLSGIAYGS
mgnify:CR=1 FL=1